MKENKGTPTLVVRDRLSPQVALVFDAHLARLELLGPLGKFETVSGFANRRGGSSIIGR